MFITIVDIFLGVAMAVLFANLLTILILIGIASLAADACKKKVADDFVDELKAEVK